MKTSKFTTIVNIIKTVSHSSLSHSANMVKIICLATKGSIEIMYTQDTKSSMTVKATCLLSLSPTDLVCLHIIAALSFTTVITAETKTVKTHQYTHTNIHANIHIHTH